MQKEVKNPLAVLGTITSVNTQQPTVGNPDKDLLKRMKKTAQFNNKTIKHFKCL